MLSTGNGVTNISLWSTYQVDLNISTDCFLLVYSFLDRVDYTKAYLVQNQNNYYELRNKWTLINLKGKRVELDFNYTNVDTNMANGILTIGFSLARVPGCATMIGNVLSSNILKDTGYIFSLPGITDELIQTIWTLTCMEEEIIPIYDINNNPRIPSFGFNTNILSKQTFTKIVVLKMSDQNGNEHKWRYRITAYSATIHHYFPAHINDNMIVMNKDYQYAYNVAKIVYDTTPFPTSYEEFEQRAKDNKMNRLYFCNETSIYMDIPWE